MVDEMRSWAMHRNSPAQQQLFDAASSLSESAATRLKDSWAKPFRQEILPILYKSEPEFACLYSDKGRPNYSVARILGITLLQQMYNLSDQQALDELSFDLRWQYALEVDRGTEYLSRRSLVEFRRRLVQHDPEMELIRRLFERISKKAIKKLGISTNEQRLDSTLVSSNVRTGGLLELFRSCTALLLRTLNKEQAEQYAKVPQEIRSWYEKDSQGWFGLGGTQERRDKLATLVPMVMQLLKLFADEKSVSSTEPYQLLERAFNENCKFVDVEGECIDATEAPETDKDKQDAVDATEAPETDKDEQDAVDATEAPETDKDEQDAVDATEAPETDKDEQDAVAATEAPETDEGKQDTAAATEAAKPATGNSERNADKRRRKNSAKGGKRNKRGKKKRKPHGLVVDVEVGEHRVVRVRRGQGETLQSPYDPEASCGHKGVGYHVHVTESCNNKDKPEIITDYEVHTAARSDVNKSRGVIERLTEADLLPETLYADGGYPTSEVLLEMDEQHIELCAPVHRGSVADNVMSRVDFDFDDEGRVLKCPQGHAPIDHRLQDPNGDGRCLHAYFDGDTCRACPALESCPVRAPNHRNKGCTPRQTRGNFRLDLRPTLRRRDKQYALQQTKEWKDRYRIRSGIEATISEAKRAHGLGRLRVRRLPRVTFAVASKLMACNVKRWLRAVGASSTDLWRLLFALRVAMAALVLRRQKIRNLVAIGAARA